MTTANDLFNALAAPSKTDTIEIRGIKLTLRPLTWVEDNEFTAMVVKVDKPDKPEGEADTPEEVKELTDGTRNLSIFLIEHAVAVPKLTTEQAAKMCDMQELTEKIHALGRLSAAIDENGEEQEESAEDLGKQSTN